MLTHDDVITAFTALTTALSALADKIADPSTKARVAHMASTVGDVAENFDIADPQSTSAQFDAPTLAARAATVKATAATGSQAAGDIDAAVVAADRAQLALQVVTPKAAAPSGLIGALRVAPSVVTALRAPAAQDQSFSLNGQPTTPATQAAPADQTKSYVASLLLLFPIEAVTLFPLGQSIGGNDAIALTLVILIVTAFVATLRYFGTKDPATGAPARREIAVAVASFLLWVGSIGGYHAAHGGYLPNPLGDTVLRNLYGFCIVMWVSIAPFLVARTPTPAKSS